MLRIAHEALTFDDVLLVPGYSEVTAKDVALQSQLTRSWEGNDVVGKARILETPMGMIVRGLLEGGVNLGVSTRGMGSLEQRGDAMYVKDDFTLSTVDIVQDPSAPNAFVNGIMEGVEWVWSNGILTAQEVCEDIEETEFVESPRIVKGQYAPQVREFKNFLSSLKKQNF
jgi:hypothetical protein